jgi:hypothetical protein
MKALLGMVVLLISIAQQTTPATLRKLPFFVWVRRYFCGASVFTGMIFAPSRAESPGEVMMSTRSLKP